MSIEAFLPGGQIGLAAVRDLVVVELWIVPEGEAGLHVLVAGGEVEDRWRRVGGEPVQWEGVGGIGRGGGVAGHWGRMGWTRSSEKIIFRFFLRSSKYFCQEFLSFPKSSDGIG